MDDREIDKIQRKQLQSMYVLNWIREVKCARGRCCIHGALCDVQIKLRILCRWIRKPDT